MEEIVIYVVLGILVAISSNFLGLGGGVLVGPLLISILFKDPHWSVGVALASAFFVTFTNTLTYHKKGWVPWRLVLKVAFPALIFSFVAANMAQALPSMFLQILLACVLIVLGVFLLYQKFMSAEKQSILYPHWVFMVMGAFSGSLSGFTGIGAGLLFMPLFLTSRQVLPGRAVACSNAAMVFSTGVGALVYLVHQVSAGKDLGDQLTPIIVISAVSYGVSKFIRDYQGKLAEKLRLVLIIFILFLLGALTLWRAFN